MKQLKNYLRSLKNLKDEEKSLDKGLRSEARENTFLKMAIIFIPLYLIILNLFIFIRYFYLLMLIANILIILNVFLYQYTYYKYLKFANQKLTIIKTLIYGLILTIIIWITALIVGRLL